MLQIARSSLISGIMVGIGVVINILSQNRYVGAMLFSLALLTIIHNRLYLYTGRIGFITKEEKPWILIIIFIFNLVGIIIPTVLMAFCDENVNMLLRTAAESKFSATMTALFVRGIFCGVLMFVAVYSKKTIITVFCIMTFILSGFEHCIADFAYFVMTEDFVSNILKFLCIVAGNSIGSICTYYLMRETENENKN